MHDTNEAITRAGLLRRLPPPSERRAIRRAAQLSLHDIASTVGCTPQAVDAWEQSTTPGPTFLSRYVETLEGLQALPELRGDDE